MEPRFLSIRTAAAYLDARPATIRRWISEAGLPAVRIARRKPKGVGRHVVSIRIDRTKLEAWLSQRTSR